MTPWYQRIGYAADDGGTRPVHLCRGCGEPYTGTPPTACPACGLTNVGPEAADEAPGGRMNRCHFCPREIIPETAERIGNLLVCRTCKRAHDWTAAEAFRPAADEAGREALDAPQREFEPGGTPR